MEMKILLIQNKPNDTIKSLHIVSNKQATYVCPFYCSSDEEEVIYEELEKFIIPTNTFHFKLLEKWFDSSDYDEIDFILITVNSYV